MAGYQSRCVSIPDARPGSDVTDLGTGDLGDASAIINPKKDT
jgi:hypothetical protein